MEEKSIYKFWGKAKPVNEGEALYHLLPYHCLDVTAVAAVWWASSLALQRSFTGMTNLNESQTRAWLLFFIALHDYGKYDIRFQLKAIEVWKKVNPELSEKTVRISDKSIHTYLHGPAGLFLFYHDFISRFGIDEDNTESMFIDENPEWQSWCSWLSSVTGHHGIIPDDNQKDNTEFALSSVYVTKDLQTDFCKARVSWVETLASIFLNPVGLGINQNPPFFPDVSMMLAGFCSVSDWIGSWNEPDKFDYDDKETDNLFQWFESRLDIAENALIQAGVISKIKKYAGIDSLLFGRVPKQIQWLVDRHPVNAGLTIIEAATGSGKTETALAYAWHLLAKGLADSIIFALPTQATANAMLPRLEKVASLIFQRETNIILAHGRSKYQQDFINLKNACQPHTYQNDEEAWTQCGRWLSQSRKRIFLGQIGICTIDQVLVSVLPVKHKFVRSFGLGRSILIIDEVHAYDAYMYGLLEEVIKQQYRANGSVILLSATLPSYQKQQLLSAWGEQNKTKIDSYPLITHCDNKQLYHFDLNSFSQYLPQQTTVYLDIQIEKKMLPSDSLLEKMITAAEDDAQVCFVCNLVDVAQEIYLKLSEKISINNKINIKNLHLFHSRYIFAHRQNIEAEILKIFGPEGERKQGHIIVATQVIEQSLDLDFDWLITQLCPVDLLFQRIGRLHRHDRLRPEAYKKPVCTVLLPFENDYGLHNLIYGNTRVLWRTQYYLQASDNKIDFPAAYRNWIEKIYCEDLWGPEPAWVEKGYEKFMEESYGKQACARQLIHSTMNPLGDNDGNVAALTRDGEMNLTIIPIYFDSFNKKCLLNGLDINELDESNREEQINLNSLGVPASWGAKNDCILETDKDGLIWLAMIQQNEEIYSTYIGKYRYLYSAEMGMRRLQNEEVK